MTEGTNGFWGLANDRVLSSGAGDPVRLGSLGGGFGEAWVARLGPLGPPVWGSWVCEPQEWGIQRGSGHLA